MPSSPPNRTSGDEGTLTGEISGKSATVAEAGIASDGASVDDDDDGGSAGFGSAVMRAHYTDCAGALLGWIGSGGRSLLRSGSGRGSICGGGLGLLHRLGD